MFVVLRPHSRAVAWRHFQESWDPDPLVLSALLWEDFTLCGTQLAINCPDLALTTVYYYYYYFYVHYFVFSHGPELPLCMTSVHQQEPLSRF